MTRSQNDFYPTPVSIIDAVMANLRWDLGRVWEPCAGDGRLVDALAANGACVVASDIVDGDDVFANLLIMRLISACDAWRWSAPSGFGPAVKVRTNGGGIAPPASSIWIGARTT